MERQLTLIRRPIRLRAGARGDLDAIERIERSVFDGDQLSRRSLRYYLGAHTTETLVALDGETVAGYAMIGFRQRSHMGWLFSLAVGRGYGRRGIGGQLLDACETAAMRRGCIRVDLEVRTDNPGAIALYDHAGYRRFGTIEDYYEDGATAIRYEKVLRTAP